MPPDPSSSSDPLQEAGDDFGPRLDLTTYERHSAISVLATAFLVFTGWQIHRVFTAGATDLTRYHEIAETIAAWATVLFTVAGYVAAAWWWRHRDPRRPRVNVRDEVRVFSLETGEYLVHVVLSVCNVGEVPVHIPEWGVFAVQIWPPPEDLLTSLRKAEGHVLRREDVDCHALSGRTFSQTEHAAERVRPGESQELVTSMLIPADARAVRLEVHVPHEALRMHPGEKRAWNKYSVIELVPTDGRVNE